MAAVDDSSAAAYDELVDAVQGKYDAIHGEGVVKVTYHPEDNENAASNRCQRTFGPHACRLPKGHPGWCECPADCAALDHADDTDGGAWRDARR